MNIDPETGESYEAEGFTTADWILGGFWTIVGVFGLIYAHLAGQARRWKGH